MDDLADRADGLVASFGTRYTLRLAMLQMTLHAAPDAELNWLLAETDMLKKFREDLPQHQREQIVQQTKAWVMRQRPPGRRGGGDGRGSPESASPSLVDKVLAENRKASSIESWSAAEWDSFVLQLMWRICRQGVSGAKTRAPKTVLPISLHDLVLEATGEDADRTIDEVLIRFCGAFLDQGFASWSLPHRDEGFAKSFARLYLHRLTIKPAWMAGLDDELRPIVDGHFEPLDSISQSLQELGVEPGDTEEVVTQALLALRGWAGMIWQMETSAPWMPHPAPQGTLNEYLAIRLILRTTRAGDGRQTAFWDQRSGRNPSHREGNLSRSPAVDQPTHLSSVSAGGSGRLDAGAAL